MINVPIMAVVIPVVFVLLPRVEHTTPGKWVVGQALVLIAGIIGVVYGIKASIGATQSLLFAMLVLAAGLALLVVIAQAAFGMWTVTLKLWPQVVTGHLLGGFATLSLLFLLTLRLSGVLPALADRKSVV